MAGADFALFDTPVGPCGVAWAERGLMGVQLPEASEARTRRRMLRRFPGAREAVPPPEVRRALHAIRALLRGESRDLSGIALDMRGLPPFRRRVYTAARAIPPGATRSYGELAASLGAPGSARAVGRALGCNPFPIVVPCHRVLAAGGRAGGFSAAGGVATKLRLLALEGTTPAGRQRRAGRPALDFDPGRALEQLRAADPRLARTIDAVGAFGLEGELRRTRSVFAALAEAIIYQQLSGKAAASIHARVCALFPRAPGGPTPEQLLGASDAELRGAGLSRAKCLALRDLARRALAGEVPTLRRIRRMSDEEIVESLTAVRGIGRWTAEMLLIFRLGRPDVLPADDYGLRRGFALAFGKRRLPTPQEISRHGRRWAPWRSVASWYLWRAAEGAGP